tara:strand:- start:469 stop:1404 length:936 start_codon:yes stop_codon:yes gene_type:complete
MSKVLVIIKSRGIGDLCILSRYIQEISKYNSHKVTVLAQENTKAKEILKYDPHVEEVIELDEKGFFKTLKKIKYKKFNKSYILSDSIRLYLISKFSNIKHIFHYKFFSKKGKNFFKTAKNFTEKIINKEINSQTTIYWNNKEIEEAKKKFNITSDTKNIICGISASGSTKRWDIKSYIKLFENLNKKNICKFFLAGGPKDENLIDEVINSSIGKNCVSFSKMSIAEAIPIIAASDYYIGNDTGWGHICSGLNLKSLFLFCDSPPKAYGTYAKNISLILPEGETLETCGHNTRGKNNILYEEVFEKSLKLIS